MSCATESCATTIPCLFGFLIKASLWNLLTNCSSNPPFVGTKTLRLFHVRSLVSLETDLISEQNDSIYSCWLWLSLILSQSNLPALGELSLGGLFFLEVVYKDPLMEVWVALRGAEGSNENIFRNEFGFNCIYLLSALIFSSVDKIISKQHKNWSIPFPSTGMSTLLHAPIQVLGQQTEVCEGFSFFGAENTSFQTRICLAKIKNVNCLKNKPLYSHKILFKVNVLYFEVFPNLIGINTAT